MIYYFDASALVKRYIAEQGSNRVAGLLQQGTPATARLSVVEVVSALTRRYREGDLSKDDLDRVIAALHADSRRLLLIELTPMVVDRAEGLLRRFTLRASDAVQLASALHLNSRSGGRVTFVGYDGRLDEVALAEGMNLPPSE